MKSIELYVEKKGLEIKEIVKQLSWAGSILTAAVLLQIQDW